VPALDHECGLGRCSYAITDINGSRKSSILYAFLFRARPTNINSEVQPSIFDCPQPSVRALTTSTYAAPSRWVDVAPPSSPPQAPPHPPRLHDLTFCVDAHGQQPGGAAQLARAEPAAEPNLSARGVVLYDGSAGGDGSGHGVRAQTMRTGSPQLPPRACRSPRTRGAVRRRARDTQARPETCRQRCAAQRLASYSHGLARGCATSTRS
jgi:hypothetical protein